MPGFYKAAPDASIGAAWAMHRDFEFADTAIDHIAKELIGLSMAAHIKCGYCIYFHTQAARFFGATEAQMREAVFMGDLTVAWSNAITGAQVNLDEFKRDVDKALAHLQAGAVPVSGGYSAHTAPHAPCIQIVDPLAAALSSFGLLPSGVGPPGDFSGDDGTILEVKNGQSGVRDLRAAVAELALRARDASAPRAILLIRGARMSAAGLREEWARLMTVLAPDVAAPCRRPGGACGGAP